MKQDTKIKLISVIAVVLILLSWTVTFQFDSSSAGFMILLMISALLSLCGVGWLAIILKYSYSQETIRIISLAALVPICVGMICLFLYLGNITPYMAYGISFFIGMTILVFLRKI